MTKTTILLMILCSLFCSCIQEKSQDVELAKTSLFGESSITDVEVERGKYLVEIMDCSTCHTPKKMTAQGPVPDESRLLSGYPANDLLPDIVPEAMGPGKWLLFNGDLTAAVGPWGISFGANLTPHPSGIGTWSFSQFKKAVTEGKHKGLEGGRSLLPPMPWQTYSKVKEDDLKAIFAYLKTIPAIENIVPAPIPPG